MGNTYQSVGLFYNGTQWSINYNSNTPTDYFWAASGNDGNDCRTTLTACQTIAHFNSFSFPTNAKVHFNGGDTFTGGLIIPISNITVTSFGTGQPTISSGNATSCVVGTNLSNVTISNLNCVGGGNFTNSTAGIFFANNQPGNTTLTNINITNNTVSGYGLDGIDVFGTNGNSGYSNVNITGNTVHDVTGNGVQGTTLWAGSACINIVPQTGGVGNAFSNVTVSNNTLFNCTGSTSVTTIWSGVGINIAETTTAVVANNLIHDISINNQPCGGAIGILFVNGSAATVQFNEVYNMHIGSGGSACDGGAIDFDGGQINSTMQYNYAHDNIDGDEYYMLCGCANTTGRQAQPNFRGNSGNTIRFNIAVNSADVNIVNGMVRVLSPDQTVLNGAIYNNTIWNGVDNASGALNTTVMGIEPGHQETLQISNNVFANRIGNTVKATNPTANSSVLTFQGNSYFSDYGNLVFNYAGTSYTSLAAWQTATNQEKVSGSPVGQQGNPNFPTIGTNPTCGGYTPAVCPTGYAPNIGSSILPNAGLNLTTLAGINPGTQDFFGNAVTASTLPIGANAVAGTSSVLFKQTAFTGGGSAGVTSRATTLTGVGAGHILIVAAGWCDNNICGVNTSSSISSMISSAGETCSQVPSVHATGAPQAIDIWYCPNTVSGSHTITATFSTTVNFAILGVSEFSGIATSTPLDSAVVNHANGTASGLTFSITASAATSQTDELLYTLWYVNPTTPPVFQFQNPGWIGLDFLSGVGNTVWNVYQNPHAIATYTATSTFTSPSNPTYSAAIVGFKHP